jgi:PAS domain S-box-containing protein
MNEQEAAKNSSGAPTWPSLWRRISPIGWVIVGAVIFVLLLGAWQNYRQLQLIEQTLKEIPEGLELWDLAQLQKEILSFKSEIAFVAARGRVDDPEALALRWDLVWSRLNVVAQSSTGRALREAFPGIEAIPRLTRLIEEIDADFPTLLRDPPTVAAAIQQKTATLAKLSQEFFSEIYTQEQARQNETRKLLKTLELRHIGIALVFIALFLILLIVVYKSFRSELSQVYYLLGDLRRSEERYRDLAEGSLQGFLVHRHFKPLFANQALADVLGYESPEEIQQLDDLKAIAAPEERERLQSYHDARLNGGHAPTHYSYKARKKDGTPVTLEVMVRVIEWEGQDAVQTVLIDVTEREREDALKRDFIATVSHELRTPLTAIVGSLGLVQQGVFGKIPETIREMLQVAQRNGERLVRLVNDILDIQKIETGKMEYRMRPVDVGKLLEHAIEVNQAFADQYGVKFKLANGARDLSVAADKDRIMQVLTNLMANAAMHSPKGGRVELGASRRRKAVRVEVSDQGPGVPAGFQNRIFEKFAQSDTSDARKNVGSGLGLSICKVLVENHGGRIGFTSKRGQGTTFYFELPELPGGPERGADLTEEEKRPRSAG